MRGVNWITVSELDEADHREILASIGYDPDFTDPSEIAIPWPVAPESHALNHPTGE